MRSQIHRHRGPDVTSNTILRLPAYQYGTSMCGPLSRGICIGKFLIPGRLADTLATAAAAAAAYRHAHTISVS